MIQNLPDEWAQGIASGTPFGFWLMGWESFSESANWKVVGTSETMISGSLERSVFSKPSIGNAACSTARFRVFDDNNEIADYPAFVPLAWLTADKTSSSCSLGFYLADVVKRDKKHNYVDLELYDRMIFAEEMYTDDRQNVSYPMPAADVVAYIADRLGVAVDPRSEIGNFLVDSPIEVYTMREVLRFIAAGSGGNFVMTPMGEGGFMPCLRLVPFGSPAGSEEKPCSALDYNDAVTITGVRLFPDGSTEYFSGDDSGLVIEGECAYATQELCDAVAAKLIGKVYRGFEAKDVRLDPAAELGDSIRFGGVDFVINSINYTFSAALAATVGSPFREDVNHLIPFHDRQSRFQRETAQSFSEIRKSTEEIALEVSKKTSTEDVNALIEVSTEGITQSFDAKLAGKTGTEEVKNMISSGINGIEISSQKGSAANSASITLSNGDIGFEATGTITMGNVTVDSISADAISGGSLDASRIGVDGLLKLNDGEGYVGATGSSVAFYKSGAGSVYIFDDRTVISADKITLKSTDGNGESCYMQDNEFSPGTHYEVNMGAADNRWANIYCGTANESSDRALKKDIKYGLDKYEKLFDALRPCSYRFIKDGDAGKINTGLIAQDVDDAVSSAGLKRADFAGLQMSDKEGASGLVYSQFIVLLIDQVQKLKKRVDELEQKNAE